MSRLPILHDSTAHTAAQQESDLWGAYYRTRQGNTFPDENIVRLVKGRYANIPRRDRALDVGFGLGANLAFLAGSGFEAYGLEVSQECIDAASDLARRAGVDIKLGLLDGPKLSFPDGFFDMVVSWNAVYYFGRRPLVEEAIREFHRVLRPGGVLLLSVLHPNSAFVWGLSRAIGDGLHRVERGPDGEPRIGIDVFYEPTSSGWRRLLAPFAQVEEGYAESDLFTPARRNAWRLFLGRK